MTKGEHLCGVCRVQRSEWVDVGGFALRAVLGEGGGPACDRVCDSRSPAVRACVGGQCFDSRSVSGPVRSPNQVCNDPVFRKISRRCRHPSAVRATADPTAPLLNPEQLPESGHSPALEDSAAQLIDDSGIARRDMVIGRYLIDANIRPILSARVFSGNATRTHRHLRVKTGGARS